MFTHSHSHTCTCRVRARLRTVPAPRENHLHKCFSAFEWKSGRLDYVKLCLDMLLHGPCRDSTITTAGNVSGNTARAHRRTAKRVSVSGALRHQINWKSICFASHYHVFKWNNFRLTLTPVQCQHTESTAKGTVSILGELKSLSLYR